MSQFDRLTRDRSVSVRIAEQIVGRIQAGEFALGTKLPSEVELARQFGVSRPSVREALGALQFVGYIDSMRGSGSRVVSLEGTIGEARTHLRVVAPHDILRLFEARLSIEPQVASLAARDPDLDKLKHAEELIEGMGLVVNEPRLHGETDLRVHRACAQICRNVYMSSAALRLLDLVASPQLRATREQAWSDGVLPSLWGSQHEDVIEAIRNRDAMAAYEATWQHLASSSANALTVAVKDPNVTEADVERMTSLLDEGPMGERPVPTRPYPWRTGGDGDGVPG